MDITIPVSGMWCERDLRTQLMSMPQIEDGACLVWLMYATAATTNNSPVNTSIDVAWGG
jgi:hypothetical protein